MSITSLFHQRSLCRSGSVLNARSSTIVRRIGVTRVSGLVTMRGYVDTVQICITSTFTSASSARCGDAGVATITTILALSNALFAAVACK